MSDRQTKKRTVAQLRVEKEQRERDFELGCQLVEKLIIDFDQCYAVTITQEVRHDNMKALLVQANRAFELLQFHPETHAYRGMLIVNARIHHDLGQPTLAMTIYRQVDEAFAAEERKGSREADSHRMWIEIIMNMGGIYLQTNQLESAKRYYLRILAWPGLTARDRVTTLVAMAAYHQRRKEWIEMIKYCEEALRLIPDAKKEPNGELEMLGKDVSILRVLADAAEGQGDMRRALEYDEKAKRLWTESGKSVSGIFGGFDRREALELLDAGRPREAAQNLAPYLLEYAKLIDQSGINLMQLYVLTPVMDALKVLADALMQTGEAERISEAELVRADVEETEAILAGYWEGVLEETRRELREQQRAGGPGRAGAGGEGEAEAKKKSKAAKRKQQKRKTQQQRRAAEVAEAAAAAAVEGGAGGGEAAGQPPQGQHAQHAQQQEEAQEGEEDDEEGKSGEQAVTATEAAMAAMGLEETKDKREKEEEDECSVCLNAIEVNDAANPAGPPLMCGHRYHAFCLQYWVERCTMKCIEPTCPYCRSPLQEVGSI